jgi:hypothetical protein
MEKEKGFHQERPPFWRNASRGRKALMVVAGVLFVAVFLTALGSVVMVLWNWLMPHLFKLPAINLFEAWGLLLLSAILFRGMPSGRMFSEARQARYRRMLRERALNGEKKDNEA